MHALFTLITQNRRIFFPLSPSHSILAVSHRRGSISTKHSTWWRYHGERDGAMRHKRWLWYSRLFSWNCVLKKVPNLRARFACFLMPETNFFAEKLWRSCIAFWRRHFARRIRSMGWKRKMEGSDGSREGREERRRRREYPVCLIRLSLSVLFCIATRCITVVGNH